MVHTKASRSNRESTIRQLQASPSDRLLLGSSTVRKGDSMMKEGLYKVEFQTMLGAGFGVVYLKGGALHGGDTGMYYVGTYELQGDNLVASVSVDSHTKSSVISQSVFGVDKANITLKGTALGDTISTTGSAKEAPGVSFRANLTFLSA
eukprot:TRINITY_DN54054_c0_g1_i1.p2 TRINITY_DN54054_c0_g1~~TRINITY_DN54054_c0_g1_i1.p2  ORF type:complete len:149 (+),score=11.47 TRINITY_DN54054_c0_g1_i1:145-591(+)